MVVERLAEELGGEAILQGCSFDHAAANPSFLVG
jgi:hypothetical protein